MMRHTRFVSAVIPILLTSLLSAAQPASIGPFLTPASLDWKTLLPPPVPKDSPEHKAELNLIVAVQNSESPQALAQAASQMKHMDVNTFADIMGPGFKAEDLPKTESLFHEMEAESKECVTGPAKKFFRRVRPADADPRVKNHEAEDEFSYPSGHSTRATMDAYVLADLFPELKDKLIERSEEIGYNRIVVGAHYPSDIVAGRVTGKAIAVQLLANPQFQSALAECRAELAAAQARADKAPQPPKALTKSER